MSDSIRKRGKWTRDGANDPGVAAMELQAWQEYTETYNRELQANGGNEAAAANAALSDFKSKFGTDEKTGQYALVQPDGKVAPGRVGKYAGYDPEGTASNTMTHLCSNLIRSPEIHWMPILLLIHNPDLYTKVKSNNSNPLSDSFTTTGSVGYYSHLFIINYNRGMVVMSASWI